MLHATSDFAFGAPNPGKNRRFAQTGQGQTVPADGPTAPEGERQEGGTIVAGTTEEPDTLHPWLTQLVTTSDILQGVMQGLLQYDSTQTLIPSLAESFEISEDGLSYTFALRQGVTWHNGDPFTAQDVIESWKMIMNDEFGAWSQLGWEKITDVTAADETSVTFVTSEPFAPFVSFVGAETQLCPASEMAAGPAAFKEAFTRNLIGTGPMKFVEWKTGEQIVVERNDAYWGTAPALERVILRHLLPNVVAPIVVSVTLGVAYGMIAESTLSFLGYGVDPATPTWGNMLNAARSSYLTEPLLAIAPGLALTLAVLAVNFVGDGLRDAFDPRTR